MLSEITPKLTTTELFQLIEEAKNAELCRDNETFQKILQKVWNFKEPPNFDNYDELIKAELLRLCGVFLSFYGNSENLKNYQVKGKDLLTNAIRIFEAHQLSDKAAEAKVMLAFCYWNEGEISECEAMLGLVEMEFEKNLFHPIYLQICVNRLLIYFWKQDLEAGLKIIKEISEPMKFCTDIRLQTMFHNQAGIFYRASKKYDKGIFHLKESGRFAKKVNNGVFYAITLNNLAYLYKEIKNFKKAFHYISESIKEFNNINHHGYFSHALDTKALILLDWNKPKNALETIKQAIGYFEKGEDYRGLTDALWTKIRCLLQLERTAEVFIVFAELRKIAAEHIGEIAVRKFANKLADEFYILRKIPLAEEVAEFKKERVSAALIESNGIIGKAAKILQLKNHQSLSDILNKQFPELLSELGFKRRAKRNSAKAKTKSTNENSADELEIGKISRLLLPDKSFSFDFKVALDGFDTYYFDRYVMENFGTDDGSIVAVASVSEFRAGMIVLVVNERKFFAKAAEYDEWTGIFFVADEQGDPIPIDETNVIGEAVGYCLLSESDDKNIEFSRFKS